MTVWLPTVLGMVGEVLDRVVPNKTERDKALAEMQLKLVDVAAQMNQAQADINKVEAANPNVFVSGWRPFLGWVCGIAFAWQYIGYPVGQWVVAVWYPEMLLPKITNEGLFELTLGMLGLGGLRTYEKKIGLTK